MTSVFATPSRTAFDAVIWDYDGTLVATGAADIAAVETLVRRDPTAADGAAVFWACEGQPIQTRIERAWPGRVDEILPLFDIAVRPRVFPGIRAALAALRTTGVRLAVVSSRRCDPLEWGLRATRLRPAFVAVVGLDDVVEPKPSPEGLLLAMRSLGVAPARTVFVGDSTLDMEAGRRAGVTAWRSSWAHPGRENRAGDFALRRPQDVLSGLEGMTAQAG